VPLGVVKVQIPGMSGTSAISRCAGQPCSYIVVFKSSPQLALPGGPRGNLRHEIRIFLGVSPHFSKPSAAKARSGALSYPGLVRRRAWAYDL